MPTKRRKRLRRASSSSEDDPHEEEVICISSDEDANRSRPLPAPAPRERPISNNIRTAEDSWVQKYADVSTQTGLLVSSRKLKDVRGWLCRALENVGPKVLILTGPPACGKSSALRSVCRELNCAVQSWRAPHVDKKGVTASLLHDFASFIVGTRYSSLVADHSTPESSEQISKHLVLVEDLPVFATDMKQFRDDFRDIIRRAALVASHPTAIILSDSARGVASSAKLLLGSDVVDLSHIVSINVPRVTDTMMKRRLSEVLNVEGYAISPASLDEVIVSAAGDCRAALNCLQFSSMGPSLMTASAKHSYKSKVRPFVKKRARPRPAVSLPLIENVAMDGTLGIFHAVSKVLNNKRDEDGKSKYDVEALLMEAKSEGSTFIEFLHQNYPQFFGEADDVVPALEVLSFADTLLPWKQDEELRLDLNDCATSIVCRGFLHYNAHPIQTRWRPIKGPVTYDVRKEQSEFNELARDCLTKLMPPRVCTRAELCELIPYAERRGMKPLRPWGQNAHPITTLGSVADAAEVALIERELQEDTPDSQKKSRAGLDYLEPSDSAGVQVDEDVEAIEEFED